MEKILNNFRYVHKLKQTKYQILEIIRMADTDLEYILNDYNWDDGFKIPKEILNNPDCDLALALKIFYLADGFAYLDGFAEKNGLKEWNQFIGKREINPLIIIRISITFFI